MENLEFKNYGLEELSREELQETEGGFVIALMLGMLIGIAIAILLYD